MPCNAPPSALIAEAVGIGDRPDVDGHHHALHVDDAGVEMHVDIGDHARSSRCRLHTGRRRCRDRRLRGFGFRGSRFRFEVPGSAGSVTAALASSRLSRRLERPPSIADRADGAGDTRPGRPSRRRRARPSCDSCANVFCRRLGERSGPVQKGDSTVRASMRSHFTVPVPPATPLTVPVTYDGTTFDPFASGPFGGGAGDCGTNAAGWKAREVAGHLISRLRVAGPAAAQRRPRFVVPRDDVAGAIEADALIDDKREAEVFVHHLVFARELHAHGTADGLRHAAPHHRKPYRRR